LLAAAVAVAALGALAASCGAGDCTVGGEPCPGDRCVREKGCVECFHDSDCTPGKFCIDNGCGECRVDADCAASGAAVGKQYFCDQFFHWCAIPNKCTQDADCGDFFCEPIHQVCVQCLASASDVVPAPPGSCPADRPRCIDTRCKGECTTNANCSDPTPVCDVASGVCLPCHVDADCESGTLCNLMQRCQVTCSSDADCGGVTPVCHHICVECIVDEDCGGPFSCRDHACMEEDS
jgi:Cys-rich repeat protein